MAGLLHGCSLLGLSDGLERASCDGPDFCADLNTLAPTNDACLAWTCGPQGVCEVLPLDEDGDGAPAMGCEPDGVDPDCDDQSALRAPLLEELCDTLDNDCDELIDEGAGFPIGTPTTLLPVTAGVTPGQISYLPRAGDAVAVSYLARSPGPAGPIEVDVLQFPNSSAGASALAVVPDTLPTPNAFSTVLAEASSTVVAAAAFAGCRRTVVGSLSVNPASFGEMTVDAAHFSEGLPIPTTSADNQTCPRTGLPAEDQQAPVGWLNSASDGTVILLAWLEVAETLTETCPSPPSAIVRVSSARIAAGTVTPATAPALDVGLAEAAEAPSLVTLSDGAGFLAAFPTAVGFVVNHIEVDDPVSGSLTSTRVKEQSFSDVREVSLALGPLSGQTQSFVVGYRAGCGAAATVSFLRYRYDTGSGEVTGPLGEPFQPTAAGGQEDPFVAFQPAPLGYLVAWSEGGQQRVARLGDDGTVLAEPDALGASNANYRDAFYAPLESGFGFGFFAFDPAASGIVGTELMCAPPEV